MATTARENGGTRWVRGLLLIIVLGIVAMWIYAFVFAPREGRYRVVDDRWRASTAAVCAASRERILALADTKDGPVINPTLEQMARRAALVDQATDELQTMLDQIARVPASSDRDRQLIDSWFGFYATVISDRRAHTARLRSGVDEPYEESQVAGGPVTNVVTDFTKANEINRCAPPFDLNSAGL